MSDRREDPAATLPPKARELFREVLAVFNATCGDSYGVRNMAAFFAHQAAAARGLVHVDAVRFDPPQPQLAALRRAAEAIRAAADSLDVPALNALGIEETWARRRALFRELDWWIARTKAAHAAMCAKGGRPSPLGALEVCYRNLVWAAGLAWKCGSGGKAPSIASDVSPFMTFLNLALVAAGMDPTSAKVARRLRRLMP